MSIKINIEKDANSVIKQLQDNGYEAYVVGGCVRDAIMGNKPHDWDICTSALPKDVLSIFGQDNCIPTGIKHGTITVGKNNNLYEVTTFRSDGEYTDNRHPNSVNYLSTVTLDLERRDFTCNSLAYNDLVGLIDIHNGYDDIKNGVIRAVGNPDRRFTEDALRIMRCFRFAARYGFTIETETLKSAIKNADKLRNISEERISDELSKILVCNTPSEWLYKEVVAVIIPELVPEFNFDQHSPWHEYDVWEHTMRVLDATPQRLNVRLAALLHDVGKPKCYTRSGGAGHFYGHGYEGRLMAKETLTRLRFPNNIIESVTTLIEEHDNRIHATEMSVNKMVNRIGENNARDLFDLQIADIMGQGNPETKMKERKEQLNEAYARKGLFETMMKSNRCLSLKTLAINGKDVMEITGIKQGKMIGDILNEILEKVISGNVKNEKESLIAILLEKRKRKNEIEK